MTDHDHQPFHAHDDGTDAHEIVDPTDVELVDVDVDSDAGDHDAIASSLEYGSMGTDVADADPASWMEDDATDLTDPTDIDLDDLRLLDSVEDEFDRGADALDGDPPYEHGVFEPTAVVAWAEEAALSGVDRSSFDLAVEALRLDPLDLDGRQTVHVLDQLGVDARVEHGSIDALVDQFERGARLVIASGVERFVVTEVDDLHDTMVLRAQDSGAVVEITLDRFEADWAAASYEMVVSEGAIPSTLISLSIEPTGEGS